MWPWWLPPASGLVENCILHNMWRISCRFELIIVCSTLCETDSLFRYTVKKSSVSRNDEVIEINLEVSGGSAFLCAQLHNKIADVYRSTDNNMW